MRHLLDFSRRPDVSELVDSAIEFKAVHSVSVGLDKRWLTLWRAQLSMPRGEWHRLESSLMHFIHSWPFWPTSPYEGLNPMMEAWPELALPAEGWSAWPVEWEWTSTVWEALCADRASQDPFIIAIGVTPGISPGTLADLAGTLGESPYPVRFEVRPQGRLTASRTSVMRPLVGGISVGRHNQEYATLGGILRDPANSGRYALTCGHALSSGESVYQPSPRDGSSTRPIGECVASTAPLTGPSTGCNRASSNNKVDAALIELDESSSLEVLGVGHLVGSAAIDSVYDESPVEVSGRSGHRGLYTARLFVIGRLLLEGQAYCFEELIELKRQSPGAWGATGTLAKPVRPGDSGSWVIQSGEQGPEWCGMIVGGDGPIGLAVFAETILEWLGGQGFSALSVT